MARVTVEDCVSVVNNRFKLILLAAQRAKELELGANPSVLRDNDKSTVIALREIADNALNLEVIEERAKQNLINNSNQYSDTDDDDNDLDEMDMHADNDSYRDNDNNEEEDGNDSESIDEDEPEDIYSPDDIASTLDISDLKNL